MSLLTVVMFKPILFYVTMAPPVLFLLSISMEYHFTFFNFSVCVHLGW